MGTLNLPSNQKYRNKEPLINMTLWMKKSDRKLILVPALVIATRGALAERLQNLM